MLHRQTRGPVPRRGALQSGWTCGLASSQPSQDAWPLPTRFISTVSSRRCATGVVHNACRSYTVLACAPLSRFLFLPFPFFPPPAAGCCCCALASSASAQPLQNRQRHGRMTGFSASSPPNPAYFLEHDGQEGWFCAIFFTSTFSLNCFSQTLCVPRNLLGIPKAPPQTSVNRPFSQGLAVNLPLFVCCCAPGCSCCSCSCCWS